ncbi:Dps family protein [Reyranella soli]|uniref:DNA starvation/stationary phase protection protein n=1 Tax=Reyranella soli TaxID=1230389 RepID=A0A512NL96_9HYPH|nr:DNA starvation/stationary phase protection protein [Reyranella soli]GEP59720.1 DNA starvation/stationary phase protection protein [Reyranella soli]
MNLVSEAYRRPTTVDPSRPTDLSSDAAQALAAALTLILADFLTLYFKTKNFRWHMSGRHFHDYHLMLDEQSTQILAAADPIAERVRKMGGTTIRSVGHISRLQRILDNDASFVTPKDMLAELRDDNRELGRHLRLLHSLCREHGDIATASLGERWTDEAETRSWFLYEATRSTSQSGD